MFKIDFFLKKLQTYWKSQCEFECACKGVDKHLYVDKLSICKLLHAVNFKCGNREILNKEV